jgi:hypothetical protein
MQILKEIGEVGVHLDGATHVLRPSLYAMTQIGEPEEIVREFASVMKAGPDFVDALAVVYVCADTDVSDIFGSLDTARSLKQSDGVTIRNWTPRPPQLSGKLFGRMITMKICA